MSIAAADALQAKLGIVVEKFLQIRSRSIRELNREVGRGGGYTVWPGGEGGIRTPDTVARMPHFECGAFNHSATSPQGVGGASLAKGRPFYNPVGRGTGSLGNAL